MASKQDTQTKKESPPLARSVMLTRFKLSQQKRQMGEKEKINRLPQKSNVINSTTTKEVAKDKKTKANKNALKNKKVKETQEKKDEFYPNRLKRNKVAKKIVLKPKHELKVIGGTGGVKNAPKQQKGLKRKSPLRKTIRTISVDSILYESDSRSESPVYSELGFEEMIRMADESQNLDDEDLNEILTCPSPVWWEDPPDASFMEGPIIVKSNKDYSSPTLATQYRGRQSRKKTPHKIILEPSISKESADETSLDVGSIIDNATLNNRNASDIKFNKKRSKLESVLSTIKNNLSETKSHRDNDMTRNKLIVVSEIPNIVNDDKNLPPKSHRYSISDSFEDESFPEISIQDNDGLKHLENIKIPIEGKKVKFITQKRNLTTHKTFNNFLPFGGKVFKAEHFKIIKNDLSKTIPRYVKNKKLKIINIKKMSPNFSSQNIQQNDKNISIPNSSNMGSMSESKERKSVNTMPYKYDVNAITNELVPNLKESDKIVDGNIDNTSDSSMYRRKRKKLSKPHKNIHETEENMEYIKLFKIFSPNTDKLKQDELSMKNHVEVKPDSSILSKYLTSFKDTDDNSTVVEKRVTDKSKLNSYYKKCKAARRLTNKGEKESIEVARAKEGDNEMEVRDDCNTHSKNSIIVPNTEDIKYCLKCSSIFDLDESCRYCVRKERQQTLQSSVAKSDNSDLEK